MSDWYRKPTRVEPTHIENDAKVYSIGGYKVTVAPDGTVTADRVDRIFGRPSQTLSNMEIVDGEIRIQITDLVGEVLTRLDPAELARELWSNEEVRAAFAENVVETWNTHWTDNERRRLIRDLQAAVHDKALDTLIDKLAGMEWHNSQRFYQRSHTSEVNRWLMDRGLDLRIPYEPEAPDFKIGGKAWTEARDDWRRMVLASFPKAAAIQDEDQP